MKLTILPDPKLRQKSLEVALPLSKEDQAIIDDMIYYVDESQKEGSTLRSGIGIAAVQLGHLKRMFYINVVYNSEGDQFRDVIINPRMSFQSSTPAALQNGEGCLSVDEEADGQEGLVHRKNRVIVKGYSYFDKKEKEWDVTGFLAIVFQHEYDHLEGRLFIDRINKKDKNTPLKNEVLI